MSVFDQLFRDNFSSVYLTLVSIIQSLAGGYLFQAIVRDFFRNGRISIRTSLDFFVVLVIIVLVWHEYSISCTAFHWHLDVWDSVIPFLLGFAEFFMVAAIACRHDPEATDIVRKNAHQIWLWSLTAAVAMTVLAYINYAVKGVTRVEAYALQRLPWQHLWWAVGTTISLACIALWDRCRPFTRRGQRLLSMCLCFGFLFHLVRIGYGHHRILQ